MIQKFKISYQWEKREEPGYYYPSVDTETINNALKFFLTQFAGNFEIHLADDVTFLDFAPDLSTIFRYIPPVLEALEKNTDAPVEFEFFEQGTELGMCMERRNEFIIDVRFEIAPGTSPNHFHMPQSSTSVLAHEFLSEWVQFTKDILKALLQIQPELANDDSYITYSNRINVVSEHAADLKISFEDSSTNNEDIYSAQQSHREQSRVLEEQQCTVQYYWEESKTKNDFVANPNENQLINSLSYFIAHHKGQILGNMGGEQFCLDLQKDLQAVFKSLPSALMKLTNNTDTLVKLDISENDLALFLNRKGDEISALFAIPSRTEEGYKVLSDRPNSMSAHRFLEQWTRFAREILSALTKQSPTLIEDKSYQDYVNKIEVVEDAIHNSLIAT